MVLDGQANRLQKNLVSTIHFHPTLIRYAYPPPDGHILTNIANALIAVPRFYTQVTCFAFDEQMNILAPFRKALPTPPLPVSVSVPPTPSPPPPPPLSSETNIEDLSGSESEMEPSDEEGRMRGQAFVTFPTVGTRS